MGCGHQTGGMGRWVSESFTRAASDDTDGGLFRLGYSCRIWRSQSFVLITLERKTATSAERSQKLPKYRGFRASGDARSSRKIFFPFQLGDGQSNGSETLPTRGYEGPIGCTRNRDVEPALPQIVSKPDFVHANTRTGSVARAMTAPGNALLSSSLSEGGTERGARAPIIDRDLRACSGRS